MNAIWIIAGATVVVYLCRLSGFVLPDNQSSIVEERVWHYVPIIVFSVLSVSPLARQPDMLLAKIIAFLLTGSIIWRTRQLGLAILLGFGLFYLTS